MATKLVYEDSEHQGEMLGRLNKLRRANQFCDVTLQVSGHTIPAHRSVLACSSKILFELFSSDSANSNSHFKLGQLDYSSLEILINYAYTARMEVERDQVRSVYQTASALKMKRASQACSAFLIDNLTPSNCLGLRGFAETHDDQTLRDKADNYIQQHLIDIMEQSPEVHKMPNIQVEIMVVNDIDEVMKEERNLCKLVVDWAARSMHSTSSLDNLSENAMVLYLTCDNTLRDCLDPSVLTDDLKHSEIVQDYKKRGSKRKQMALQASKDGSCPLSQLAPPTPNGELPTPASSWSDTKEWHVIASTMLSGKKCVCVAKLGEHVSIINVKLHLRPTSPPGSAYHSDSEGSGSPLQTSPATTEKQCSLVPLEPMSSPRCGVGVASIANSLVALGGYDREECLITVESFDMDTNVWSPMPGMISPRGRFNTTILQDCLYACGGSNGSKELKSAERYSLVTGRWAALPDMKLPRTSAGVVGLAGKVYVIGGCNETGGLNSCEAFDPENNKWSYISSLSTSRHQAATCTYGGKIYTFGGCDVWNCLTSGECYDPETEEWSHLPHAATPRRGAGVTQFGGKIYLVGGSDGQSSLSSVEIYDPVTSTWSLGPQLTVPRANVGVITIGDRLFAVGGFSGKAFLDSIEYLCERHEWCAFVPRDTQHRTSNAGSDEPQRDFHGNPGLVSNGGAENGGAEDGESGSDGNGRARSDYAEGGTDWKEGVLSDDEAEKTERSIEELKTAVREKALPAVNGDHGPENGYTKVNGDLDEHYEKGIDLMCQQDDAE